MCGAHAQNATKVKFTVIRKTCFTHGELWDQCAICEDDNTEEPPQNDDQVNDDYIAAHYKRCPNPSCGLPASSDSPHSAVAVTTVVNILSATTVATVFNVLGATTVAIATPIPASIPASIATPIAAAEVENTPFSIGLRQPPSPPPPPPSSTLPPFLLPENATPARRLKRKVVRLISRMNRQDD
ncbi:hypothetical protein RHS04_07015 [Rhizoctonia solani]|uniref:Uncharacterized protein n=1 Tax=Rhizoctonia solani TaxID=456999 RepID=A0A8H7H472_9AGAM|nr:hypothetical protein RHS04_07015 [Rhizoctonia solani]